MGVQTGKEIAGLNASDTSVIFLFRGSFGTEIYSQLRHQELFGLGM